MAKLLKLNNHAQVNTKIGAHLEITIIFQLFLSFQKIKQIREIYSTYKCTEYDVNTFDPNLSP